MNLDQIYQELTDLANCNDAQFASAAQHIGQLTQQAQQGQLDPAEYQEILLDIQRQLDILESMEQMAFKQKLNTCINGLIKLVGAV